MAPTMTEEVGPSKTWDLSLYELNRAPQEVITDDTEIAVSPRSLHSELMCPVCLDLLKNTMTTKECLHRFCSDCIIPALRIGNKECPTCRKKLVSKRSLRPDPNFDLLISKIYPSRAEYEAHQERVLAKLNNSQSQAALVNSITEGIKLQNQNRPKQRAKKSGDPNDPESVKGTASNNASPQPQLSDSAVAGEDEMELVIKPHPEWEANDASNSVRYIKTTADATVDHVSKYLAMRLTLELETQAITDADGLLNFCIYVSPASGQFVVLSGAQTLRQVNDKFWKANRPLEIYYSWKKT